MRILLTRDRAASERFARRLRRRGHTCVIAPLFRIEFNPLAGCDLPDATAILFTSANGVRAVATRDIARRMPVFAVGDTTARVAKGVGFRNVHSARGDASALVRLVRKCAPTEAAAPLLWLRGRDANAGLSLNLTQLGYRVEERVVYSAERVERFPQRASDALADGQIDIVMLLSARTASAFTTLLPEERRKNLGVVQALVPSAEVAERILDAGFAEIEIAPEPSLDSLLSLVDTASWDCENSPSE